MIKNDNYVYILNEYIQLKMYTTFKKGKTSET